ncbi:sensor histidine kinase [Pseudoroseicyclus tamaricis]|uniref:histidine kinase n=1 Tax=Pseudoroseicyclus tamaricis TaxID=2705421 RepID=A0A6B2K3B7_9RHOB|nr:HAMP domain-containing sensor histidine kinase [Pseudoroseicyclus tamaricis]NDV01026.1 HAMP domain-containing histidine kinase [Pseudoroseicyclus tamaricis]
MPGTDVQKADVTGGEKQPRSAKKGAGAGAPVADAAPPPLRRRREPMMDDEMQAIIYRISHDLRAPARALHDLPSWVEEDLDAAGVALPGQVSRYLELMRRQAGRMHNFIADLLTHSRVGRMQEAVEIDLASAVADALRREGVPQSFQIEVKVAPGARPVLGPMDLDRLLSALISNAVRHHRGGGSGQIGIEVVPEEEGVRIVVTDDGPGIAPEDRERAFAFLTTLRSRDEVEGSGMGIPIAARICEAYGGTLELESLPEREGCRFTATLRHLPEGLSG